MLDNIDFFEFLVRGKNRYIIKIWLSLLVRYNPIATMTQKQSWFPNNQKLLLLLLLLYNTNYEFKMIYYDFDCVMPYFGRLMTNCFVCLNDR